MTQSSPFVFCAIDTPDLARAQDLARAVGPVTGGLKLGLEFVHAQGPQGIAAVQNAAPGAALFLDLKLHDIPNTVASSLRAVCRAHKPAYVNVHAAGGAEMMNAALAAVREESPATKLLAVTVLTSMDQAGLQQCGAARPVADQVLLLARLAQESGLDGVVCSALELAPLRAALGPDFILMVPGIRPAGGDTQDQKRVMTPAQAKAGGATHIVVGRPITDGSLSPDPAEAARMVLQMVLAEGS